MRISIDFDSSIETRVLVALDPSNPTPAGAKQAIVQFIKSKVSSYEAEQSRIVEQIKVRDAQDAMRTRITQAQTSAESEIVIT